MARLLESDVLSNQNISSALAIGAYTCTGTVRLVYVRVLADQVAGNGTYTIYATLTKGGTERRVVPITDAPVATGLSNIAFVSLAIPMDVDDVLTVYLDGLAGDTTTPDTQVDFYEADYVRPATADRTLDVDSSGLVALTAAYDAAKTAASASALTTVSGLVDDLETRLTATRAGYLDNLAAGVPTAAAAAAAVWAYVTRTLTQTAAQIAAIVAGTTLTVHRGETLSIALTALGNIAGRMKLWFTVKASNGDDDADSVIQIEESSGLLYFNGAVATPADGSLIVTDPATGAATIALAASVSDDLVPGSYRWDMQMLSASGIQTLAEGAFVVTADITRAVA